MRSCSLPIDERGVPARDISETYDDAEDEMASRVSAVPLRDKPGTSDDEGGEGY